MAKKRQRLATFDRLGTGDLDVATWVEVDEGALDERSRSQLLRRKAAVKLYLAGATHPEIKRQTGYSRSNAYRILTKRCLMPHPDGNLWGWRGALPGLHIQPYTRRAPLAEDPWGKGQSGALQALFASPGGMDLERRFASRILDASGSRGLKEVGRSRQALYGWFIQQAREMGVEARGEWPFNVGRQGYVTICRHIDRVLAGSPRRATSLLGGPEATKKARAGDGTKRPPLAVFQRVECDAHHLDVHSIVLVPSPAGGHEAVPVHRLWVIVLIEVTSRAVLGYVLSRRREPAADDVLRAVKMALTRWNPKTLQFSDKAYGSGACFPSYFDEQLLGACWEEFSVDGALANVCARVRAQLQDVVGARLLSPQEPGSFSCRRTLDDRPYIESFFRCLTGRGFHRLSTTSGGSPKAKQGRHPQAEASRTQFQLEYAEELLDVFIANYNGTPHSSLGNRSPVAQLQFLVKRAQSPIRKADPGLVRRLCCPRKRCTVLGQTGSGRRPHVNFMNAAYSAEWLCSRSDLVGETIWIHVEDEDDVRIVSASLDSGLYLGSLMALPPWNVSPHTLYMRSAICSLHNRRLLHLSHNGDPVALLVEYGESAVGSKLPAHPAYLEARRVLQAKAQELTGTSMVEHARTVQGKPGQPEEAGALVRRRRHDAATSQESQEAVTPLPPRRPAQVR